MADGARGANGVSVHRVAAGVCGHARDPVRIRHRATVATIVLGTIPRRMTVTLVGPIVAEDHIHHLAMPWDREVVSAAAAVEDQDKEEDLLMDGGVLGRPGVAVEPIADNTGK